jgi:peptidoglycan hydrolase-like protein with peptidoglycan-binding domain
MNARQNWRSGFVGALTLLTLISSVPTSAAAQQNPSLTDLQARIAELQATIAALRGTVPGSSTLAPFTWNSPLRLGSTGEAVRELQRFLNQDPDTRVAVSGPGSIGNETMTYGPATAAAVSRFQMKYRSEILSPSGLVNPTGVFGPASIAKANTLRNAVVRPPVVTEPTPPSRPTPPAERPTLRGDGELDEVRLDEADDTDIPEAAADAPVAEIEFSADNGDIRIDRLEVALIASSGNTEKDPWDTFDTISLWVDGDKVVERSIDRRADYVSRNSGIIRFTGLNLIVEEDEVLDVTVALTVKNNVKGAGSAADWSLELKNVRYFDAANVATNDSTTGDLGDAVDFTIVNRGDGEALKFSTARGNPTATTIVVDDSRRTNNQTVLVYEIEAIDADVELETLAVVVETVGADYQAVVSDARLTIGNRTFRVESVTTTGSYSSTRALLTFDIDGRVTIDEGDTEEVKLVLDFKPQSGYQNGTTIKASVTSLERDLTVAEGSDDITDVSGTAIGNTHRLVAEGVSVTEDGVRFETTVIGQDSNVGTFRITFPVTAIEGDFYITEVASTTLGTSTGGVGFTLDGDPNVTTISAILTSSADEDTPGVFTVREGRTETFTLSVTLDPTVAGQYRIGLSGVVFSSNPDGVTAAQTMPIVELNKFRTPYQFINN